MEINKKEDYSKVEQTIEEIWSWINEEAEYVTPYYVSGKMTTLKQKEREYALEELEYLGYSKEEAENRLISYKVLQYEDSLNRLIVNSIILALVGIVFLSKFVVLRRKKNKVDYDSLNNKSDIEENSAFSAMPGSGTSELI